MEKKFCPILERNVPTKNTNPENASKPAKGPLCPLTGGVCKGCVLI